MLAGSGSDICRPEKLPPQYGIQGEEYVLSPVQAQAILDLRLHRLTGLEQDKIIDEFKTIIMAIKDLMEIISNKTRLLEVIRHELLVVKQEFGDVRRTQIVAAQHDFEDIDLITQEDMVVTLSHGGYIKSQPLTSYQAQRRGGRGKAATIVKDEDYVDKLVVANTHDTLLCFSNFGKVYWLKAYHLPVASRTSRGRPLINLLPLQTGERISALLSLRSFEADRFVFMATQNGIVKKVALTEFSRPRSSGIIAIDLDDQDKLVGVDITDRTQDIMLFSNVGKVVRFSEEDVRPVGRTARGVRGIRLKEGQLVISLIVVKHDGSILTATEKGYGKRTLLTEFSPQGRGGQGVIAIQTSARNGQVIGAVQVFDQDELMLISNKGTLVRTRVDEVSVVGRNTQGVKLISLGTAEQLNGLQRIDELEQSLDEFEEGTED